MKKRRLFVGGLPWGVDDDDLKALFENGDAASGAAGCGSETVEVATVVRDRETRKSRGFAFITMTSLEKAAEAVQTFNGLLYQNRTLKVDEAADQGDKGDGGGRRGGNTPFRPVGNDSGSFDYSFRKKKKEYKEY